MIENALPDDPTPKPLKTTPLDAWHRARGARMVEFAGYAMPVQYQGVLAEHLHCRSQAALFDVSHMGQATLTGATAAAALERLVPGDMLGLKPGRQRYTLLTNEAGGIIDDLMVANLGGEQPVPGGQCQPQGRRLHPYRRRPARRRATAPARGPRAARTARPGRRDGACPPRRRRPPRCHSWASPRSRWPASRAWSRAPATPARTDSRSPSPAEHAEALADKLICRTRSNPGRPRCARFAAAGGWPLPVRQRHR